jgi:hypothetical protein
MDNLFLALLLLSWLTTNVFIILSLVQFIKKNKPNGMKQLKLSGVALIVFVISLVGFAVTMEPTTTTNEDKTEVVKEKKTTEKSEEPKTEEKVVVEEESDEEKQEEKVETSAPITLTWQDNVKEIANSDSSPTEKYDAVVLYSREYLPTDEEIEEFEKHIITEYQSKNYLADITNAEYMLSNVFRANVIQKFYDESAPINKFAFDFEQNTKYTYLGVDAVDSESVKANESQMDKMLANIQ